MFPPKRKGGEGAAGGQADSGVLQLGRRPGADREAQRGLISRHAQGHQPPHVSQRPRGELLTYRTAVAGLLALIST